mmetsp:Transcript_32551/g.75849  ORF Transcript_32551/g.75849 Transcript_32551/m.75849 type:complete len:308 (-) Transcript_32551:657-1580(-)
MGRVVDACSEAKGVGDLGSVVPHEPPGVQGCTRRLEHRASEPRQSSDGTLHVAVGARLVGSTERLRDGVLGAQGLEGRGGELGAIVHVEAADLVVGLLTVYVDEPLLRHVYGVCFGAQRQVPLATRELVNDNQAILHPGLAVGVHRRRVHGPADVEEDEGEGHSHMRVDDAKVPGASAPRLALETILARRCVSRSELGETSCVAAGEGIDVDVAAAKMPKLSLGQRSRAREYEVLSLRRRLDDDSKETAMAEEGDDVSRRRDQCGRSNPSELKVPAHVKHRSDAQKFVASVGAVKGLEANRDLVAFD